MATVSCYAGSIPINDPVLGVFATLGAIGLLALSRASVFTTSFAPITTAMSVDENSGLI